MKEFPGARRPGKTRGQGRLDFLPGQSFNKPFENYPASACGPTKEIRIMARGRERERVLKRKYKKKAEKVKVKKKAGIKAAKGKGKK